MRHLLLIWIALSALASASLASAPFAGDNRLGYGRISLHGEVESVVVDFGPMGKTSIFARAREDGDTGPVTRSFVRSNFSIPIPVGADQGPFLTPTVTVIGGGEARYLGWEREPLPILSTLAKRSLPPVERSLPRPSVLALLVLGLSCTGIWLLLRSGKGQVALGLGAGATGLVLVLGGRFVAMDSSNHKVVDFRAQTGQVGSWSGVLSQGAMESIRFDSGCMRLEVVPEHSPLELRLSLDALRQPYTFDQSILLGEAGEWEAIGPRASRLWTRGPWGGTVDSWLSTAGSAELPQYTQNLGDFDQAWIRTAASEIKSLGPLRAGQGARAKEAGGPGPPAWLLAGLPMGRAAFLGRLGGDGGWVRATWDGL